jgi:hypothetical protein
MASMDENPGTLLFLQQNSCCLWMVIPASMWKMIGFELKTNPVLDGHYDFGAFLLLPNPYQTRQYDPERNHQQAEAKWALLGLSAGSKFLSKWTYKFGPF